MKRIIIFCFLIINYLFISGQDAGLLISPGKLSNVHASLSGIKNCSQCHTTGKRIIASKCLDCHKELLIRITKGKGYHRDKSKTCLPCHPDHLGTNFKLIEWDIKKFDHAETGYPIKGLHKKINDCGKCHKTLNSVLRKQTETYLIKNSNCAGCHQDTHKGGLGDSCEKCHDVDTPFKQARSNFNHKKTDFPLIGKHLQVNCVKCHKNNKWKGFKFDKCNDCHKNPHKPSFRKSCSECHNSESWKLNSFSHSITRYPLKGEHSGLKCVKCHKLNVKNRKIPYFNCNNCHKDDPHKGQYNQDCKSCHNVWGFKKIKFNHNKSNYLLRGKHAKLKCIKCHKANLKIRKIPYKNCTDCHKKDPHNGQFQNDCKSCHNVSSFKKLNFDHKNTKYPLEGKHKKIQCIKCHFPQEKTGIIIYKPLNTSCINCHKDIHFGQFKQKCENCHSTFGFKGKNLKFIHNKDSEYLLEGKHANTNCIKCHLEFKMQFPAGYGKAIKYSHIDKKCNSCHKDFHSGQLDLDCSKCHSQKSFKNAEKFNHNKSRFKLDLFHIPVKCEKCHPTNSKRISQKIIKTIIYKPIKRTCNDCHRGFVHDKTSFPLKGSHKFLNCSDCHNKKSPNIKRLYKKSIKIISCNLCHISPHPGTYGRCLKCHNEETWRVESFL